MKLLNTLFCFAITAVAQSAFSQNQFNVTSLKESLVCVSDCSTAAGENNEACYPNEIAEYNFNSSKIVQSAVVTGGWDGDQLDEVSFRISDLQSLYAGARVEILGIERKGYNYGPDYISTWSVKCSLKK